MFMISELLCASHLQKIYKNHRLNDLSPLCPFLVCLPCCFLVFSSVFSAALRIWSTPRLLGKYVWKIWMCSLKYCYSNHMIWGDQDTFRFALLLGFGFSAYLFQRNLRVLGKVRFLIIDVKHGSNMDRRALKLEPWQLVPKPPTPGRLAFVNRDLWCTSTSRIDVLGRPKDSGICWTSLRNFMTYFCWDYTSAAPPKNTIP